MAVTIAPSTEAMQSIVERLNSNQTFELKAVATYSETMIDPLEEITDLRVDVVCEAEEQLIETLDIEDRTSHQIRIWLRKKVDSVSNEDIDCLKLLYRQIFQRVNNFDSSNGRVKVWTVDNDTFECPIKSILQTSWLFVATMILRVEVEASY